MPYSQQASTMSSFMPQGLGLHGAQLPMLGTFPWLPHQPLSQPPRPHDSPSASSQMPSLTQLFEFSGQQARQAQQDSGPGQQSEQHAQRSSEPAQHAQRGSNPAQHAQHASADTDRRVSGLAPAQQAGPALNTDSARTDSGPAPLRHELKANSDRAPSDSVPEHYQFGTELSEAALLQHARQMQDRDSQAGLSELASAQQELPQDQFAQPESSLGSLMASEQLSGGGKSHRPNGKSGAGKANSGLPKRQMNFWQEEEKTAFINAYKVGRTGVASAWSTCVLSVPCQVDLVLSRLAGMLFMKNRLNEFGMMLLRASCMTLHQ